MINYNILLTIRFIHKLLIIYQQLFNYYSIKKSCFYSSPYGLVTKESQLRISDFDPVCPFGFQGQESSLTLTRFAKDSEASQNFQIGCHG